MEDPTSFWTEAVKQAPVFALFVGFAVLAMKRFFAYLERHEDKRQTVLDARHTEYFKQLGEMNERNAEVIEQNTETHKINTEMLGQVKEALRYTNSHRGSLHG